MRLHHSSPPDSVRYHRLFHKRYSVDISPPISGQPLSREVLPTEKFAIRQKLLLRPRALINFSVIGILDETRSTLF